jgi:glycosyltransferase involved in cell wall biosynthesis
MKSNNNFPKISVITPSYNQGKFIERTIRSVIDQAYPNLEYFVIDGGSTDETVSIIKKYESKIAYWISEKDKGQADAINKGLQKCTGEIIGWLNSDDMYDKNTLAMVAENFEALKKPFLLSANFRSVDENENVLWEAKRGHNQAYLKNYSAFNLLQCWKNTLPQPSTFWTKDVTQKIGVLNADLHFAMDLEYWLRCIENKIPIYFSGEIYSSFRRHSSAKSSLQIKILQKDLLLLNRIYLRSDIKKIYYRVTNYVWFNHTYKVKEAIALTESDLLKSVAQLALATIAFPIGIFTGTKHYLVFVKHFFIRRNKMNLNRLNRDLKNSKI